MVNSKRYRAVVKKPTKDFLVKLKDRLGFTEDELIEYALAKSFKKR